MSEKEMVEVNKEPSYFIHVIFFVCGGLISVFPSVDPRKTINGLALILIMIIPASLFAKRKDNNWVYWLLVGLSAGWLSYYLTLESGTFMTWVESLNFFPEEMIEFLIDGALFFGSYYLYKRFWFDRSLDNTAKETEFL